MQKRYCQCGNEVQVTYGVDQDKEWRARFFLAAGRAMGPIRICPKCTKKLHINALR